MTFFFTSVNMTFLVNTTSSIFPSKKKKLPLFFYQHILPLFHNISQVYVMILLPSYNLKRIFSFKKKNLKRIFVNYYAIAVYEGVILWNGYLINEEKKN